MKRAAVTTFVAFLVFAPAAALAHPGHDGEAGLVHGFVHPITGIDHILAMVAVGLLAAQYGGRALWLVPMTFLVAMAIAGAIGMAGILVPIAEVGIGLSVVVLGLAIAFQLNLRHWWRWRSLDSSRCSTVMRMALRCPTDWQGCHLRGFSRRDGFAAWRRCRTWTALATADIKPAFDSSRWGSNGAGWHCSVGEYPLIKGHEQRCFSGRAQGGAKCS